MNRKVKSEERALYIVPPGVTPSEAEDNILAQAEAILHSRLRAPGEAMTDPKLAGQYFKLKLVTQEREVFAAMFLDTRHRVLAYEELFFGTVDSAEIHPREVIKRALHHNAAAVILGHNHPSGTPEPSAADRAVTARIKQALVLVEIRLLDHFVVAGDNPPVSLAAKGWV